MLNSCKIKVSFTLGISKCVTFEIIPGKHDETGMFIKQLNTAGFPMDFPKELINDLHIEKCDGNVEKCKHKLLFANKN